MPVYRPFSRRPLPLTVSPCVPRNPQYRSLAVDANSTVGNCAAESRTRVSPAFSWSAISPWTMSFTVWKPALAWAWLEIVDPSR